MDLWKTSEKQKMRNVKLIDTPELAAEAKARGKDSEKVGKPQEAAQVLAVGEQLTLDDTGFAGEAASSSG